jgi:hypothetical protein
VPAGELLGVLSKIEPVADLDSRRGSSADMVSEMTMNPSVYIPYASCMHGQHMCSEDGGGAAHPDRV